jgi:hypothetical protein
MTRLVNALRRWLAEYDAAMAHVDAHEARQSLLLTGI